MEFTQLRCFLALVREPNFGRAAKACHMTQPALSYQIGRLEDKLGEALFIRKPRAVDLSDSGKLLLESAALIVEEQDRVVSKFKMREQLGSGEAQFGIIPTMAPYLLPSLLGSFRASYPGIGIVARESRTSQLVKEVVAGDLEFAIVSDVPSEQLTQHSLHLTRLFQEDLLVAAPNAHPVCALSRVRPSSINERDLILLSEGNCLRDQTMQLCKGGASPSALVCEQLPTQLAMVAAGLGVAVVPEMAIKGTTAQGVSFLRFADPAPKRLIGLLKRRGLTLSLAARELVKRLRGSFEEAR
jgi:LysR family hydrogen peroxide-inducible transcriptional activator